MNTDKTFLNKISAKIHRYLQMRIYNNIFHKFKVDLSV